MKCLKIERGKGKFINSKGEYIDIDQIGKDDLLYLLDIATNEKESFSMDNIDKKEIDNPAHKIIYQNLYDKFTELLQDKTRFIDESRAIYKDALNKYKQL